MKKILINLGETIFVSAILALPFGYLFFGFLMDQSNNALEYFIYSAFAVMFSTLSLVVLGFFARETIAWDKNSRIAKSVGNMFGIALVFPFAYALLSITITDFSVDIKTVNHIDPVELCGENSDVESFTGINDEKIVIGGLSNEDGKEVTINIFLKEKQFEKTLIKGSRSATKLCLWLKEGREIFVEDVTTKTPFGFKKHYGDLLIEAQE